MNVGYASFKFFMNKFGQFDILKTWVEKSDEALKEQVLERLNRCCEDVKAIDYVKSYESFNTVLHDVVYFFIL